MARRTSRTALLYVTSPEGRPPMSDRAMNVLLTVVTVVIYTVVVLVMASIAGVL